MDSKYFTITTSKQVSTAIEKQCSWDAKYGSRSYELGAVRHEEGFSVVQIKAKAGHKINPEDIFWLGHFSASNID